MVTWASRRFPMLNNYLIWRYGVFLYYVVLSVCRADGSGTPFQDCGGVYEKSKGVIYTPNFPNAYPTPINCEWLIHGSPEKKIIIYFTQFYMKDSFFMTEYDYYQDKSTYIGLHDLGRISSWQHDLSSIAAYKPYVLIQFSVNSIGNRHLRVMDSLLDVYGFNITYEIVDRSTEVRTDTCSVKECSYLGNCIASSDFSTYKCECFEEFFGNQCQYGPYCDPDNDINQCSNGGRCKYFFGSLINQCECLEGFYGAHCEIASGSEAELDKECKALNCSQLCDHENGRAICICREGYKMDMDNGTCIPMARYRMDVTLKLASFVNIPKNSYERRINSAKQYILDAIEENGISTISKFGIKGLRNSTTTTLLDFFFYCKVSEVDHVDRALRAVVKLRKIGIFRLKEDATAVYEKSPELHLAEVSNYDSSPALQGKLLTLVCAARGSKHMKFQWYKDRYKVETGLTQRNAWETKIPDTVHGMQLSVLNIDNVSPFDAGTFTCEVTDFDDVQYKDVLVEVKNYPQVDLGPMSASIRKGQQVSIKCICPDEHWQEFFYEWFKNGVKIDPDSREEYAEDMYPTGVRLVVTAVVSYAEYTCRVTNDAGSANVTAYVYAYSENETESFCSKNYEGHVMWQQTSGGHFDIQRCPTEQGVVPPFFAGYARRNCWCDDSGQCSWTKPNFAKCQSIFLINIYDELEALRLGYQQTTLKNAFDKLYYFVLPNKTTILYSGDIDMVAGILKELLVHMKNFPQLVLQDEKIPAAKLVKLMSEIVTRLATATDEEKEMMLAGANIIRMTSILFSDAGKSLNFSREEKLTSDAVEMQVDKYLEVAPPEELKVAPPKQFKTLKERSADNQATYNKLTDVLVIKVKKLTDLLYHKNRKAFDGKDSEKGEFPETVSSVHSVAPYVGGNTTYATPFVEVTIQHTLTVKLGGFNTTVCLTWSVDSSNQYKGQWETKDCRAIYSAPAYTICHCKIPAHIVAAIGKRNTSQEEDDFSFEEFDTALLVGYSVSMVIIFVTLYVYLRACGQIERKLYSSHLSFIVCLFLSNILVLICVVKIKLGDDLTVFAKLCLHFFYTAEFSFLLVEMMYVFMKVIDVKKFQLSSIKCLLIGWGNAILIVVMVIITSSSMGYNNGFHKICWLSSDHWQIYSFLVPVALLVLCYIVLFVICVWNLRKWKEEWRYKERQDHIQSIAKTSSMLLLLLISCLLALDLTSSQVEQQKIAHISFHISLVIMVFINRCVFDKHVRYLLKRLCLGPFSRDPALKTVRSSGSFRAFMKPEKVSNVVVSQEEYSVSRYYEEVNRTKYTNERKRQLSVLLGSSGASDITGDTKSTSVSGGSKGSDIIEIKMTGNNDDSLSDNAAADSGIFDYPEGERTALAEGVDITSKSSKDTDIHTSIFTDPLGRNIALDKSEVHDYEKINAKAIPDDEASLGSNFIKGPEKVSAHITDSSVAITKCSHQSDVHPHDENNANSIPVSAASFGSDFVKGPEKVSAHIRDSTAVRSSPKLTHKSKSSLQNEQNSPRTRLKGQIEQVNTDFKNRNGYIKNPDSNISASLRAREGDLEAIEECVALIHDHEENKNLGADGSSCSSKLLSSSADSNNDSPVSQE